MPLWHTVMAWADVRQGLTAVDVGDEMVLLVRQGDQLHACAATCPHKFTALADGTLRDGRLTCPLHAATFDLSSGRPMPGQDWAGNLPLYPVRITEGMVEVQV